MSSAVIFFIVKVTDSLLEQAGFEPLVPPLAEQEVPQVGTCLSRRALNGDKPSVVRQVPVGLGGWNPSFVAAR
jgi:hypothetical protein